LRHQSDKRTHHIDLKVGKMNQPQYPEMRLNPRAHQTVGDPHDERGADLVDDRFKHGRIFPLEILLRPLGNRFNRRTQQTFKQSNDPYLTSVRNLNSPPFTATMTILRGTNGELHLVSRSTERFNAFQISQGIPDWNPELHSRYVLCGFRYQIDRIINQCGIHGGRLVIEFHLELFCKLLNIRVRVFRMKG